MTAVKTKEYVLPPVCIREVLRYSGCAEVTPDMEALANECAAEAREIFSPKICYGEFPVKMIGDSLDLGFARVSSRDLEKNLEGCDSAVVFCATVGHEIDRLIKKIRGDLSRKGSYFSRPRSRAYRGSVRSFLR